MEKTRSIWCSYCNQQFMIILHCSLCAQVFCVDHFEDHLCAPELVEEGSYGT